MHEAIAPSSTVTDTLRRPLRDLRISVTDRCNFRCSYCMPKEVFNEGYRFLPGSELLSFDEIERLVRVFVELGVRKIRLTGGEPLLRPELTTLIARLRSIDGVQDLAMTTNGFLLERYAKDLVDAGLDRVTVSLDSLREDTYEHEHSVSALPRVLAGVEAAHAAGLTPIKLNCVVRRQSNVDDIVELSRRFRDTPMVLRFIEYMDVGTLNDWSPQAVVTADEILARISADAPLRPLPPMHDGEVARRYGYQHHAGEIGIISSISQPFCSSCHRARLSADGRLLTCLFACGGLDLKDALRRGEEHATLMTRVQTTWQQRGDRYSELRAELQSQSPRRRRLEMYQIGG